MIIIIIKQNISKFKFRNSREWGNVGRHRGLPGVRGHEAELWVPVERLIHSDVENALFGPVIFRFL